MHKSIVIDHISRIEGHGGITVKIKDGEVADVNMDIFEGPRFFEPLVVGRSYDEVAPILMRICAICSPTHTAASLMAVENAFGIEVTTQTRLLRELLVQGGNIESHALHLFCLSIPDFLNYPSVIALASDHPQEVKMGLELKKLGNTIQEAIGGRIIHPVNAVVGGFGKLPAPEGLSDLKEQLKKGLEQSLAGFDLVSSLQIPDFCTSPNVFAALFSDGPRYSLFGDRIYLSTGDSKAINKYKEICNEGFVAHSHAKQSLFKGKPFAVGALARIALNGEKLSGQAKKAKDKLGMSLLSENMLYNNAAQAVEIIYSIERSMEIIDELLSVGIREERPVEIRVREGTGTGAVEAPRGTLYHSYSFDKTGRLTKADVITPTAQNLANIEKDLRVSVENLINEPKEYLGSKLEMVVRAYDPCISCAVHLLKIN
ncbi:MAG TPA: Ni/Fe hydrogenase subunit alpha [Sedimentisphaerales bacterium]|nr:Ni/Fe hydrogenase subunit alpha [Sedimentisphaerales bacterium]